MISLCHKYRARSASSSYLDIPENDNGLRTVPKMEGGLFHLRNSVGCADWPASTSGKAYHFQQITVKLLSQNLCFNSAT